jgi:hypothetical protein
MARVPKVVSGEPAPLIGVTRAAWSSLEKKLGRKIPSGILMEIIQATNTYLSQSQFEDPPSIAHAKKRVASIYEHALKLRNVLAYRPAMLNDSAALHGEFLIGSRFNQLWGNDANVNGFRYLMMMAGGLVEACHRAKTDLSQNSPGAASPWDTWTNVIALILARGRLPYGLSKAEQHTTSLPFLRLIEELQGRLPQQYRKHDGTHESLVQALLRARERSPKVSSALRSLRKRKGDTGQR